MQWDEDILPVGLNPQHLLAQPFSKPRHLAVLKWKLHRNVNLICQRGVDRR